MGLEPIVPVRALEHHTYCKRQCALIHGDGVWADSRHTVRGVQSHRRVDEGRTTTERSRRVLRSIPLWSEGYGLAGRADVVEVHSDGLVVPVEYKAGVRHGRAAELQLCAQALCLEEMFGQRLTYGFIWYGGPRRRDQVLFDDDLRAMTVEAIADIRASLVAERLPEAPNDERCTECQLAQHCLPQVVGAEAGSLRQASDSDLYACDI